MADAEDRHPPEPESAHVRAEQVADLLEGLLPDAEAATVAAHLDECAECANLHTRLTELPATLLAEPVPPMPADVAARLDAALAEAASERLATGHAGAPDHTGAHPSTVTSLADRRRRFLSRAGTGLAAAAAVIVGVVVVGDVFDRNGDGADSAAGGSSEVSQPDQASPESADLVRARPPRLSADDFRAGVAGLLSGARPDGRWPAPGTEQYARVLPTACSAAALRSAGIPGAAGPQVLLDGMPVTLVTSGPPRRSLVTAYSCAAGQPVEQARTYVDLVR
jgi:hypothetical protein